MIPTTALQRRIAELIYNDTTTIGAPGANLAMRLAKAPFTPSRTLTLGDITEADYLGYFPFTVDSDSLNWDSVNNEWWVTINPVRGGYLYVPSASPALPQTIYGFYLTDEPLTTLYGSALLDVPVPLVNDDTLLLLGTSPTPGFRFAANSPR